MSEDEKNVPEEVTDDALEQASGGEFDGKANNIRYSDAKIGRPKPKGMERVFDDE
ncbi:MAG: hypothetical protein AAGC81_08035 [Pseudomonadota bacterium]